MKKKVGGKVHFLQKEIFMEIKCVQTLALDPGSSLLLPVV